MCQSIQLVAYPKHNVLGSTDPPRKNNLVSAALEKMLDQARNVFGFVLPIAIHNHDRFAFSFRMNKAQTDGDCALVAEVTAQAQDLHRTQIRERLTRQIRWRGR